MGDGSTTTGFEERRAGPFVFDFEAFERMDRAGVFDDHGGKVELIEGEVLEMAPAGFEHTVVISDLMLNLGLAMRSAAPANLRVLTQGTLRIGDHSAPEPDLFVARVDRERDYFQAEDAVLVVEVATSTLETDRSRKRPLYARAGIPELWIVEPGSQAIHVHRQPQADGTWGDETTLVDGVVSPLFAPEIQIALSDVFRGV